MIHINNFIDKIKAVESKHSNTSLNFPMTIGEAKNLHADITKLLLLLTELQKKESENVTTKIEINGGDWN